MRHFIGLCLGLVFGPVILLSGVWAYSQLEHSALTANLSTRSAAAIAILGICGLTLSILISTRFSPAGTTAIAVIFATPTILWWFDRDHFTNLITDQLTASALESFKHLSHNGSLVFVASILAFPFFMPRRWKKKPQAVIAQAPTAPLYPPTQLDSQAIRHNTYEANHLQEASSRPENPSGPLPPPLYHRN